VAAVSIDRLLGDLGLSLPERLLWSRQIIRLPRKTGPEYRRYGPVLRRLVADPANLASEPGGIASERVLAARRTAIEPLALRIHRLHRQAQADGVAAVGEPLAMTGSFVHLSCNRLLGRDASFEQSVLALLRRVYEGLQTAIGES
jgi:hypothetical protein